MKKAFTSQVLPTKPNASNSSSEPNYDFYGITDFCDKLKNQDYYTKQAERRLSAIFNQFPPAKKTSINQR